MKKKFITLCFVVLTLVVLTSCKKPKPSVDTPTQEDVTYTITFDSLGGSSISEICGVEGTVITAPSNPTKTYFTFAGWYTDKEFQTPFTFDKMGNTDITLYAKWTPYEASVINFNTMGGSKIGAIHGTEGDSIQMPQDPTKEGYTFAGWFKDMDMTTPFTDTVYKTEEITLYAKWTALPNMYSITYHIGDNTVENFMGDSKVVLPTELIPEGVTLEGWYKDALCKEKLVEGEVLTESIHAYANVYTTGLSFDGESITGYTGVEENVYLPSVANGTTITTIAEEAFFENKTVKSIYVPSSVITIEDYAFYNAEYLININLSSETQVIGDYAFYGCKRLKTISTLGNTKFIGDGAFSGCAELRDFEVSKKLVSIGTYAFAGCEKITTLEFGSELISVKDYAFLDCKALQTLTFESLDTLGKNAFFGCKAIENFAVTGSQFYKFENGFLTDKAGTTLIKYFTTNGKFTLPSTVTTIFEGAFEGNTNITTFDITSLETVEKGALYGMKNLKQIIINDLDTPIAYYFGASDPKDNGTANAYVCNKLEIVVIRKSVQSVPDYTFYGINNLHTVKGVDTVTEIGAYAFAYTGFESYQISNELVSLDQTAFYNATKLKCFSEKNNPNYEIINNCVYDEAGKNLYIVPSAIENFEFANSVETVMANAFNGVVLPSLVVTNSNIKFEKGALAGVSNLEYLEMPFIGDGKDNQYMQYLFGSTLTKETKVDETTKEEYDAYNFDTLDDVPATIKEMTITGTVTEIGPYAFAFFGGLAKINISETITTIGDFAFARTNFQELVVPKTVQTIGRYAYAYNYRLQKVTVSSPNLGEGVFANNFRLTEATFEDGVLAIPNRCFNPYAEKDNSGETILYSSLKTVNIAKTVKSIGDLAFLYAGSYGDNVYSDYTLALNIASDSVLESIGLAAFERSMLIHCELPATVKTLGREAFAFCSKLEDVTFGDATNGSQIESIGEIAFANAEKLKSVTIYKNVTTEEELPELVLYSNNGATYYPFIGVNAKASVYVPSQSVEIYKASTAYIASGVAAKIKAIK